MKLSVILPLSVILLNPDPDRSHAWAGGSPVINEIYCDHPGEDGGWEFVEIYNGGAGPEDISDWRLDFIDGGTGAARTLWRSSSGVMVDAGGYVLVAGPEYNPGEEFLLTGIIGNGPDAVVLFIENAAADLVGFGPLDDLSLCESSPAPDPPAGRSISRRPDGMDTGDNAGDFMISEPSPGRRNYFFTDASGSFEDSGHLFCEGESAGFAVRLGNAGIDRLAGEALIEASLLPSGLMRIFSVDIDLEPGSSALSTIEFGPFPGGEGIIRAVLSLPGDENRSNDTCEAAFSASPGEIVVNEIMYRPPDGGSEWMELFNRSLKTVDVAGWSVCDATGKKKMISNATIEIPPGSFLLLAEDPADLLSFEGIPPDAAVIGVEGGWPALNDAAEGDSADMISLYAPAGALRERVAYPDLLQGERGRSLERVSAGSCSSDPSGIWHRSVAVGMSTPGRSNSTELEDDKPHSSISVTPEKYFPSSGELAAISGRCADGESGFSISIFAVDGSLLRSLCSEKGGARSFCCRWDGRDDRGKVVPLGIYICVIEFIGSGGGVCRVEKRCIAVAGEFLRASSPF